MYKLLLLYEPLSQAARPQVFITHLQLGLGVQLHHYFGSKYLIETLYPGQLVQYVGDNVDHNIHTIDDKDTFHGMCIIAAVTPSVKSHRDIPRLKVTTCELEEIDKFTFISKAQNHIQTRDMNHLLI